MRFTHCMFAVARRKLLCELIPDTGRAMSIALTSSRGSSADSTRQGEARPGLRRPLIVSLVLSVLLVPLASLPWTQGGPQLHTLMEVVSTGLALVVTLLSAARYLAKPSDRALLLVGAMGGTAALDGYHAVVTSAFFAELMPTVPDSLIPWSWGASRSFLAAMMLIGQAWLLQRAHQDDGRRLQPRRLLMPVMALTLATFVLFAFVPLGPAYRSDALIGRPAELVAAAMFFAALCVLLRRAERRSQAMDRWLLIFLVLSLVSQLLVMPFSQQVFDAAFDVAHLIKLFSYAILLLALLEDIYLTWSKERRQSEQIAGLMAELQLRNRALEERNTDLLQFARVASHDLKAPLRSINGFAQLLAIRYGTQLDTRARDYIQQVTGGTARLESMVEDLLGFARLDSERRALIPVALDDVLAQVQASMADELAQRDAQIELPDVMPKVLGDPAQLRHLFRNLLGNALKFCKQRPEVRIRVHSSAGRVQVSVQDNGIGIAPEYHQRIFEIFQRLHRPEDYDGDGIGLALCRRIAQRHGGRLSVNSAVGAGACFQLELKAA